MGHITKLYLLFKKSKTVLFTYIYLVFFFLSLLFLRCEKDISNGVHLIVTCVLQVDALADEWALHWPHLSVPPTHLWPWPAPSTSSICLDHLSLPTYWGSTFLLLGQPCEHYSRSQSYPCKEPALRSPFLSLLSLCVSAATSS